MSCSSQTPPMKEGKMAGLSLVAGRQEVSEMAWQSIDSTQANWLSIMPYAFGKLGDTSLVYNINRQWKGEKISGAAEVIQQAHKRGYKIMLKPHLWLRGGFTGHHEFTSDEQWEAWERNYTAYILEFAKLSDSLKVSMFCIGTELGKSAINRPLYWQNLISEIKKVYSGKLTYAANWDTYRQIPFWQQLDYIGIDAYFPLNTADQNNLQSLQKAWMTYNEELQSFSKQVNRQIIFTEWGCRSVVNGHQKPWEHHDGGSVDEKIQKLVYEAFFTTIWQQPYLAGGFVWKWYTDPVSKERIADDYTPQGKPAQEILRVYYQMKTKE